MLTSGNKFAFPFAVFGKLKAIEISGPEGGPIEHDHTVTDDDAAAIRDELKSLGLVMGAALEDEVGDDGGGGE